MHIHVQGVLQAIGWIICAIYATIPSFWLAIHPFIDRWRKRRSPYRIILPGWIAMWIVAGAVSAPWRHVTLYSSLWTWIPAVALFIAGIWLYSSMGEGFSAKQLGGIPEVLPNHPEQRLITSGIRSYVRHPVYLGHFCEMLAWSLGTATVACFGLTAFAVVTGLVMVRLEDRELVKRFGEEYTRYRERVPALLPLPRSR